MTSFVAEEWVRRALCMTRAVDPDWFHPGKRTRPRDVAAALAMCAECQVREECLANALEYRDPWGIWGGTTEGERSLMLRRRA